VAKTRNYVDIARHYANDVVSGKILACKWVIKACQRQIDDLERKNWKFHFDEEKANRICKFVELMPHVKGSKWAGQKIRLEPWQCFIFTTIFGWVDAEDFRRFRLVYISVGRKNAKSTMSAPVGIYLTCMDGEMGQEVYSAATTRDQAKIVWEVAKQMVERSPDLRKAKGIDTSAHSIFQTSSGSKFIAISAEGNSLDGLNGSSIIDELHAHRTRKVYDVLETAKAARQQAILWNITTAGFDRSGICYEVQTYLTKILERVATDESFFGMIYTLDEDDRYQDEKNWIKANPNLDVSVDKAELRRLALKASKMPSALTNFLTKHMNVWVNASVNLFDITKWQKLGNPELKPEDFKLEPCWLGFDYAPRNDFSSRCQLFRREEKDGTHYYAFWNHFLSEGKVEESENASYQGWAREGLITTCDGNQTSTFMVAQDMIDIIHGGYQVQELDFDASRTAGIEEIVIKETGVEPKDIPQQPSVMCLAAENLSALIADGKIHHNGDPVMTWMLSNVVGRKKGNWGLFPDKERDENKIDGMTALLVTLNRAMVGDSSGSISYTGMMSINV
jgi:phage terminase large subunit-like protein